MFGRKLYESRINTTSKRSRKLYEGSTGSPIFDKIRSILVGAFCYGDDGENARITDVSFNAEGIPTIKFTEDETGRFYFERLDWYLDAIELDKDDREFIEDYLESLGLNESVKHPANRRLSLNEGINDMKMSVNVTKDTAKTIFNFITYSRELIKEVGLEPINPKEEKIFLQNDTLYYQISYMQINPAAVRTLQTRFNKYKNNPNFPAGMTVDAERGVFTAPLKISGEIKVNAANTRRSGIN